MPKPSAKDYGKSEARTYKPDRSAGNRVPILGDPAMRFPERIGSNAKREDGFREESNERRNGWAQAPGSQRTTFTHRTGGIWQYAIITENFQHFFGSPCSLPGILPKPHKTMSTLKCRASKQRNRDCHYTDNGKKWLFLL